MGNLGFVNALIEKQMMDLHCAYIGKVISTNGKTAKVQPLGKIKEYGSSETKSQAVVDDVPVACRYKFTKKKITYSVDGTETNIRTQDIVEPEEIKAGHLVVCLCADRDISAARSGQNELPPAGRHSISDSIIVGIL